MARLDAVSKKTVGKIERLAESVLATVKGKKNPFVEIPIRSLANVHFDQKKGLVQLGKQRQKRYFFNVSMAKKFMQTFLVSDACKELVESGKTTSIRDLYYITKHTIGDTRPSRIPSSRTWRWPSTRCARSCTSSPPARARWSAR
jgi:DNA topoisomerase-6 subunit A